MTKTAGKKSAIRVLIVDDHAVVRSGLHLLLDAEGDIEVVGEAGDVRDAIFEAREQKPDVILMDVVMPGKTGIEAIPDVLQDAPEAVRTAVTPWGEPDPGALVVMRRVKERFDPARIFSPGSFVGGI